jgi:hypothetical protein
VRVADDAELVLDALSTVELEDVDELESEDEVELESEVELELIAVSVEVEVELEDEFEEELDLEEPDFDFELTPLFSQSLLGLAAGAFGAVGAFGSTAAMWLRRFIGLASTATLRAKNTAKREIFKLRRILANGY